MEKLWGLQVTVYRMCLAWGRHSVRGIVITRTTWRSIWSMHCPILHICKMSLESGSVPLPLRSCSEFQFPRPHSFSALRPPWAPEWCFSSCLTLHGFRAVWKFQPRTTNCHQLPTAPRKPQGAEAQAKMKPERKERVCTPITEEAFSCPDQILLLPQKSAQSSLACGPLRPQGHPLTALPGPGPEVLIKCKKKKVNSSHLNKEQILSIRKELTPWRYIAWVLHHKVLISWQKNRNGKRFSWREKLAG